jgi:type II secretory pathway pseudopilin PulG
MKAVAILRHSGPNCSRSSRSGWTIVDLIVVVSIVGLLGALSLNSIQAARESARQLHCLNNLRQIGLATTQFEGARRHYPTGGWGWKWVADSVPNSTYGQPGGWIYQLLPYLENNAIYELPHQGGPRPTIESRIHVLLATPCVTFHCPSRGNSKIIPFDSTRIPKIANLQAPPTMVALTDYVANGGTKMIFRDGPTGSTTVELESANWAPLAESNGMLLYHNRIRTADVSAGLSNVLWVAEKYVGLANYEFDHLGGNDQSMYSGETSDIRRFAPFGIIPDWSDVPELTHIGEHGIETSKFGEKLAFGTPHPMTMNSVLVDGSTRKLDVNVDLLAFYRLANRRVSK